MLAYPFIIDESGLVYEFHSIGKKGKIIKVAKFLKITSKIYDFGFGDLDSKTGNINDLVVSNNGDDLMILTTIGSIILDFTNERIGVNIFFQGSTKSRNRLYQIMINRYWLQINLLFTIRGFKNEKWTDFKDSIDYEAYLITRKY